MVRISIFPFFLRYLQKRFPINMNIFDICILIPIAIGLVFGVYKGFVQEIISLLAVVVGVVGAGMFRDRLTPFISHFFSLGEDIHQTIAYLLIFVGILVIALLIGKIIRSLLKSIKMGWLDSILGGGLGMLKVAIIVSIFLNIFDAFDSRFQVASSQKKQASIAYYPIMRLSPILWKKARLQYERATEKIEAKQNSDEKQ